MIKIPYGDADFKAVITEGYFYQDRSHYIQLLEEHSKFLMFLRPRRFGKSLFINMLAHYYGIQHVSIFNQLFGNLHIGKHPTALVNQYLVLQFDFSGIETNNITYTFDAFLRQIKAGVRDFMTNYVFLLKEEQIKNIKNQETPSGVLSELLTSLSENLVFEKHKIYVLIDEYDQFTNELLAFHPHHFQTIVSQNGYVRKFYEVLKFGTSMGRIGRIFITGVAPVTVDSMTSGFNIASDITLDIRYHNMMGFIESEVKGILIKIEMPQNTIDENIEELRHWYDGYLFNIEATEHLYNTDMVLYFAHQYLHKKAYPAKMLDSNIASDYQKIASIFNLGGGEERISFEYLNQLLETGECTTVLTERFNPNKGFTIDDTFSMLFYMGMLTIKSASSMDWTLQMPNYVIKKLYFEYFTTLILGLERGRLLPMIREAIKQLIFKGNMEPFAKIVGLALQKAHSNRDKIAYGEKHLKTLMIGLLYPHESYRVCSEYESEGKYPDIFLERIPQVNIPYEIVIELKYIKKEDALKFVEKQLDGSFKILESPTEDTKPKRGKAKKIKPAATIVPNIAVPITSNLTLLDAITEQGTNQLKIYMHSQKFERPNVLGFCLVFVGNECQKMVTYPT
jgi:Predicted AAA-ATPase